MLNVRCLLYLGWCLNSILRGFIVGRRRPLVPWRVLREPCSTAIPWRWAFSPTASLLFSVSPVKRIRGAYKVVGFNDQELLEKVRPSWQHSSSLTHSLQTQRKGTLADEAIRIANGILSRSSSSPFPKPTGKKDDIKGKDAKKGVRIFKCTCTRLHCNYAMIKEHVKLANIMMCMFFQTLGIQGSKGQEWGCFPTGITPCTSLRLHAPIIFNY